jgi:MSHA biogenesis protein MshQ
MEVSTEYYNGTNFVTNTDDSCTVLSVTEPQFSPVALSWTDNLGVGETAPDPIPAMINLTAGVGVINFTAAGIGNDGSVDYQYNTNSVLPWLNTENEESINYADNPKGKVTFGQFRGNDRMIYWREIVR